MVILLLLLLFRIGEPTEIWDTTIISQQNNFILVSITKILPT